MEVGYYQEQREMHLNISNTQEKPITTLEATTNSKNVFMMLSMQNVLYNS